MPVEMRGQRVELLPGQDPTKVLKKAGDYCGPVQRSYTKDGKQINYASVYFLLPIARDPDITNSMARLLHHCASPPHQFFEEPDGTLTIRESIGAGPAAQGGYYWHGFLTNGCWELNKTKSLTGH